MENSGDILFKDDQPQWYVALGEKWIGPLKAADVYEKIQHHEITWAHFIWKKGQAEWKRICDTKTFQAIVPHQPSKAAVPNKSVAQPQVRKAPARAMDQKNWFLYYRETQYGPFSRDEIESFLKNGKIHGRVFGWKNGMGNWERLETLSEFAEAISAKKGKTSGSGSIKKKPGTKRIASPAKKTEQRVSPRRPLVAKILMADERSVIVGMCRDISVGGLQVLTDEIPGNVGARLKMNISPSSNETGNRIEPFTTEGVIARIMEDGRGFSFRFSKLSTAAQQAIESYIESPG